MTARLFPPPWSVEEGLVIREHNGQALAEEPGGKQKSVEFCCDAADRTRQTFSLSSFLKDENSVSE